MPPPAGLPWAASHAAVPVPRAAHGGGIDVYFTTRDPENRGHVARAHVDLAADPPVVEVEPKPLLAPGPLGAHDDRGVTTSCLVERNDELRLYYTGWRLGVTVPFYLSIGLAVSTDGGETFDRPSDGPILGTSRDDPYLVASPWVLEEGGAYRMWYVSGTGWTGEADSRKHHYRIVHAESSDGVAWTPTGHVCLDYRHDEHAFSRPCVVRDRDLYRMWYSYRGAAYRIGYAESQDGLTWERLDERSGIDVSPSSWDSEMLAYPVVFDHDDRRIMLYNGNGYGATGIGWAVEVHA